jgi:serine/threonine protein kinase
MKTAKNSGFKGETDDSDVFEFGYLLFSCALGGLDILEESIEEIYKVCTCCPIHYEQKKKGALNLCKYFSTQKYSNTFIDLLCALLKKNKSERIKFSEIGSHPWFVEKTCLDKSPDNTLLELIQIGYQQKKSQLPIELQGASEKQLDRILDALKNVIPFCENTDDILKSMQEDNKITCDLANDLGLDADYIMDRLQEVLYDITSAAN